MSWFLHRFWGFELRSLCLQDRKLFSTESSQIWVLLEIPRGCVTVQWDKNLYLYMGNLHLSLPSWVLCVLAEPKSASNSLSGDLHSSCSVVGSRSMGDTFLYVLWNSNKFLEGVMRILTQACSVARPGKNTQSWAHAKEDEALMLTGRGLVGKELSNPQEACFI